MKKIILSLACLLPLGALAQEGFTINGKVGSLNAPAKAYLSYRVNSTQVKDSAELKDGAFQFKGKVEGPTSASITVKHAATQDKTAKPDVLPIFLENKTMQVASADSVKRATIKGSPLNDDNARRKALLKPAQDKIDAVMKDYNALSPEQRKDTTIMKGIQERYSAASKEMTPINKKFAEENRNSYIGFLAYQESIDMDFDPAVVEPEFMKFSAEVRNTPAGRNHANTIAGAKKRQVGVTPPDFTQNDPDGKPVKLSDFRGKYVLVDFWASWCGPCRAENPNLVAAYNKYKDKNFTILGVSLDQPGKKDAWLEAVQKDGLAWTQVSDLKFWDNEVSKAFGIQFIPQNLLIDPKGVIVAKNIRGEELQKKLAEIFGAAGK